MTHNKTSDPLPIPVPSLWRLECCGATLCCTGVLAPSISVPQCGGPSNVQQSSAMMDLVLKSICVFFFTKGCQNMPAMMLLEGSPICLQESFGLASIMNRFVRFNLDKTGRQNKNVLIPHKAGQEVLSTIHGGSRISK